MAWKINECGFCSNVGPHPEAHIFPRALQRGDPGQAYKLINIGKVAPAKRSQTGIYDSELWCDECEARSSKLDTYAAETLLDEKNIVPVQGMVDFRGRQLLYECVGADPARLQLFALSVLWRASASKRPELKGFSLGPYQNRLRDILRTEDQQKLRRYPLLIQYEDVPDMRSGFFTPARSVKRDFVIFRGGGFSFRVKMTNCPLTPGLKSFAIVPGSKVHLLAYSFVETPIGRSTVRTVKQIARRFGS